jgi:hypothetical protein
MPVSPQDFNLWARATGNKYPSTLEEKARLAPEVHNFVRNFGKQGALGEQQEEKQPSLAQNIAKGALIAGGVAAGVAAARDPRVQQAVRGFAGTAAEKASGVRDTVQSFLSNLGTPRVVDQDVVRASGDVTPNPIQQQSAGATIPDSFEKYVRSLEAPVGTVSPSTGQSSTLFDYERRAIPYPGARERAREQFARSLEAPVGTVSPSTGQSSTLFNLYDNIAQKYPDPGVGKDVEFKPGQKGISSGKESLATDPSTGERYIIGGGPSLTERMGLESSEPLAPQPDLPSRSALPRSQGRIVGEVGSLKSNVDEMSSRKQRIARNQQKDFDRVRSYMSDVMDSVISEDIDETLPSSVINLATKIQDLNLPLTTETVNNFNAWAQKTFASDPEVLSEINHNLEQMPANLLKKTVSISPQVVGEVGSLKADRADQLISEYRQGIVDREIDREAKVKSEIAAMKEGAAMRIVDELRAEAAQEKKVASNASQQTTAPEVAALVDPTIEYAQPETQTDTTNSLYSSPTTPDNRVPKVSKVFDNSLKGQHDIATAIDNETDNVLSRSQSFLASQAAADPTAGQIQIDPQLSLFGPREPRATIAGRPYRYTQLGRGPAQRFGEIDPTGEQLSSIRGLGTQTVLDTGGVDISKFSSDPKTKTAQQQALNIFQATGDPSFLKSTFGVEGPSMPTQVTIGGRSVPTSELYTPFKTTEGGKGYEFEGGQIQRAVEELAPAEKFRETIKSLAQQQLGLAPGETPTPEQLRGLDPSTIRLLRSAASGVQERQSALDRAEDFAALYKLRPEITMGVTQKPVVSSITGEYLGTRSAVDRPGVYTPELYRMRASGGLGRQEAGGVGRRREMLASQEGYAPSGGSELDSSTVLFKDPETGNVLTPSQVTEEMSQYLKPIRGTAVEPQRILGQQDRTYKGVGTQEIDPRSFDPAMLSQLAKQSPERVTPEGLIYSIQALGGGRRAKMLAEQQAARQAQDYAKSIQLGAELAPKALGGTEFLPGIQEGEQLARATGAELMGAMQTGTPQMQEAARNVLAAREQRQKQTMSLKASQELNRILRSGRPNATREARAYLKGLQEDM